MVESPSDQEEEQNMSTATNSVLQATPYPENSSMNGALYRGDERTVRKPERTESSFLDTIVGRRGSLRSCPGTRIPCVPACAPSVHHHDRERHSSTSFRDME